MIANIQPSVLYAIGSNQAAQVDPLNRAAQLPQTTDRRVQSIEQQEGTVQTSVDGDVLTISPQGNAYADRAADVTAQPVGDDMIANVSAAATDEGTKSLLAAEEKEQPSVGEQLREEWMDELKDELYGAQTDLSGYTDSELAGMLSRGEISRAEYEAEVDGRESLALSEESA